MTTPTTRFKHAEFNKWPLRRCHYCGVLMFRSEATTDHKVPRARGGINWRTNFVLACYPCNKAKGTSDYEWFKQLMLPVKQRRKEIERDRREGRLKL